METADDYGMRVIRKMRTKEGTVPWIDPGMFMPNVHQAVLVVSHGIAYVAYRGTGNLQWVMEHPEGESVAPRLDNVTAWMPIPILPG